MLITIYAIKDIKVSEYQRPFAETNVINAVRGFHTAARDKNTMVGQFPEDFELHEIASFDSVTGKYKSLDTSKFIANAQMLLSKDAASTIQDIRTALTPKGKK